MTARTTHPRWASRLRAVVASLLIVVGLALAPVAVVGSWARTHLVDTDRFVSTFAPLADDPAIQNFVADQIVERVETQVDFTGFVDRSFADLASAAPTSAAQAALDALRGPAIAGIHALLSTTADRAVHSNAFSDLWERSLRLSHSTITAVLDGEGDRRLQVSDDGTLTLQIDPILQAVKASLIDSGLTFLERVDVHAEPVTIIQSDKVATARAVYRLADTGGFWLPWVSLALIVLGVLAARRRRRAAMVTAVVFTVLFIALALGVNVGHHLFVGAVSPEPVPADTAGALYDQVTALASSTIRVLALLGAIVAFAAWLHGASRPATAIRSVVGAGFARVRSALDRNGGDTGAFGRVVDRFRSLILGAATVLGLIVLLAFRPVTLNSVAWLIVVLGLLVVGVELVRRPSLDEVE